MFISKEVISYQLYISYKSIVGAGLGTQVSFLPITEKQNPP
ncbi:hypothetical protein MC7420_4262 [Coleofasciculus chthonoplastes PCC 7420]|uniref:Uncharacterized protein n=1 Tax=Coleofasciculus chthonoplastes PCC 7420 TaxID=118168 RepID=B4W3Y4_9CYAN|nr:hypothetical protein MC7420_4262 [Coleofasciculus chthonoplastes PCC 7420]